MKKTGSINSIYVRLVGIVIFYVLLSSSIPKNNFRLIENVLNINDTVLFIPNVNEGWNTLSKYLTIRTDSVVFDIILERNVAENHNWNNALLIGDVGEDFKPDRERVISYIESPRVWQINFLPSGKCILKLLSGEPPQGSYIVLPIQTRYKQ